MTGIEEIRRRLHEGSAVILTASELKERLAEGEDLLETVDVVTCGTCGVMSGTYAVLSMPVAPPGTFLRAESISLNGVPAIPGPCPNERLGLVDLIVYGTAHASGRYGGGHLFRDLVQGEEIHVSASAGGKEYSADLTLQEMPSARLFTTRSAFRNYVAIVNRSGEPQRTIFSVLPLEGNNREATVSGCGEINPIENDPSMRFLGPGTPVILNGSPGRVIGTGTRSSEIRPNLSVHAEMKGMDPSMCGGFVTSAGPECITSIGTAIPLVDEQVLRYLKVRDSSIQLPVNDISDRQQTGVSSYDRVWTKTCSAVRYHPERCKRCESCNARVSCPVGAVRGDGTIDQKTCFVCGTCIRVCRGGAYEGDFGSIPLHGSEVPIVLRQSDRRKAEMVCRKTRELLRSGEMTI